jgi:hypothetical protein
LRLNSEVTLPNLYHKSSSVNPKYRGDAAGFGELLLGVAISDLDK